MILEICENINRNLFVFGWVVTTPTTNVSFSLQRGRPCNLSTKAPSGPFAKYSGQRSDLYRDAARKEDTYEF